MCLLNIRMVYAFHLKINYKYSHEIWALISFLVIFDSSATLENGWEMFLPNWTWMRNSCVPSHYVQCHRFETHVLFQWYVRFRLYWYCNVSLREQLQVFHTVVTVWKTFYVKQWQPGSAQKRIILQLHCMSSSETKMCEQLVRWSCKEGDKFYICWIKPNLAIK